MAVSTRHRLVLLGLLLIVAATKWPTLSTPYYWDETGWVRHAYTLSALPLWQVVPGLGVEQFGRRPPGLFLPVAALFQLFGPSIWLAHAVIACFALVGAYFTYRLGDLLYGRTAGILAALFLFFNAIYFAQAGMFLADLPAAACGVASVYWMLRGRYGAYLFWAGWLVLIKETAPALVVAITGYALITNWQRGVGSAVSVALRWALPLVLVALYYGAQHLVTGRSVIDFAAAGESAAIFDPHLARTQAVSVTRWLFVEQWRWLCTALIAVNLLRNRSAWRRPEMLLFGLIFVGAGYAFSVLYFLPRYLLLVAPYFFVLAASALVELFPAPRLHRSLGAGLVALMIAWPVITERPGTREWDMGYLAAVHTYQATAAYLEQHCSGARIVATWPLTSTLTRPELGYVTRRLDAMHVDQATPLATSRAFDVIVDASIGDGKRGTLAAYAAHSGWPVVAHFEEGGFRCDVYALYPCTPPH